MKERAGQCTGELKSGRFSAEEDALVLQRVAEWGEDTAKTALWASLEQELGRAAACIRKVWSNRLRKQGER